MPFLMSVALQLFDQQAAEPPIINIGGSAAC